MFVIDDIAACSTVNLICLAVVIDVINVYLAVDVTTADFVFFATAIVIVVTFAVALITVDTVSLVVINVIFVVVFVSTIRIDVVCYAVINVVVVDFFVNMIFADVFVFVFIVVIGSIDAIFHVDFANIDCGIPQFKWC